MTHAWDRDFVRNYLHDFNDPNPWGGSSVAHEVGDVVRMVDMDPSAGYALARITQTSGPITLGPECSVEYTFQAEIIEGTFRGWEPYESKDVTECLRFQTKRDIISI